MGEEFYIPLTNHYLYENENSLSPIAFASFNIVATEDSTSVQIYSRTAVDGHPANTSFTHILNRGQTYSCAWTGANYDDPATHPAGAVVISDKPVAITISDDSDHANGTNNNCYDLIGDQIIPVDVIGEEYIIIKGQLNEKHYNICNWRIFVDHTSMHKCIR